MTTMLSVQQGVPMPEPEYTPKTVRRKYPVDTMQVDDMFFLPGRASRGVSSYISRITKDLKGKWATRHCWMIPVGMRGDETVWQLSKEGVDGAQEGTGVWRIE